MRNTFISKLSFVFLNILVVTNIYAADPDYISGPQVDDFITYMADKYNLDQYDLSNFLYNAKYQADVIKLIQKPAEKLPWYRYESLFLQDNRVKAGVKFWQENAEVLDKASKQYGVPAELIVSLIGVETFYGNNKGKFPVLDTLATLAFYYPPRSKFFISELEHFLVFSHEENSDPRTYLGSYAGAMGYPQFIASSIRNYAIDYSNSGNRDLENNTANAIGSVANYINKFGWKTNEPITVEVSLKKLNKKNYNLIAKHIDKLQPKLPVKKLTNLGINLVNPEVKSKNKFKNNYNNLNTSLLSFEEKTGKQYRLGFNNFYVITKYNNSQNYALAVYLLSEKIKQEYQKTKVVMQTKKV